MNKAEHAAFEEKMQLCMSLVQHLLPNCDVVLSVRDTDTWTVKTAAETESKLVTATMLTGVIREIGGFQTLFNDFGALFQSCVNLMEDLSEQGLQEDRSNQVAKDLSKLRELVELCSGEEYNMKVAPNVEEN